MPRVRICISLRYHWSGLVVPCNDWYRLNFNIATKSLNRPAGFAVQYAEDSALITVRSSRSDAHEVVDVGEVAAAHDHLLVVE